MKIISIEPNTTSLYLYDMFLGQLPDNLAIFLIDEEMMESDLKNSSLSPRRDRFILEKWIFNFKGEDIDGNSPPKSGGIDLELEQLVASTRKLLLFCSAQFSEHLNV